MNPFLFCFYMNRPFQSKVDACVDWHNKLSESPAVKFTKTKVIKSFCKNCFQLN